MQTEKAIQLCSFLLEATYVFNAVFDKREFEFPDLQAKKDCFTEAEFDRHFNEFEDELRCNMVDYNCDLAFIAAYIQATLTDFYSWEGFSFTLNQEIIRGKHEVPFLLKLKQKIEFYNSIIKEIFKGLYDDEEDSYIRTIFDEEIAKVIQPDDINDPNAPEWDFRFDFAIMKEECVIECPDTISKISFIHNRIFDFKQWQVQYDEKDVNATGLLAKSKYKYSSEYYPNFLKLCNLELERLKNQLEIEDKALTHNAIANDLVVVQGGDVSPYSWNASDTDLLEVVAALHKNNSIKQKDSKPLTRKELIDYFQQIFNMDIKDVEGKLSKATSRKKNMTPFLDSLKGAFESYAEEKEGKLAGRR